ncbi:MAG TPA: sigma-70 family RNA polymerase sigma factor [Hanamia sp.]|nr:sigma-70 family RNA polymerase sigma factor [Hanamia sp.]
MAPNVNQDEVLRLIQEHQKIIYKICNSYCNNKNDREDLGQEIVYQLIKSYPAFNPEFKFSTWMYRVALNVAISFYRKAKNDNKVTLVSQHEDYEDNNEHVLRLEDNISILQQFIDELKELDKALMILYLESKSYKEITEIIGISETNVATRISRIKEKLKQRFSNINQH